MYASNRLINPETGVPIGRWVGMQSTYLEAAIWTPYTPERPKEGPWLGQIQVEFKVPEGSVGIGAICAYEGQSEADWAQLFTAPSKGKLWYARANVGKLPYAELRQARYFSTKRKPRWK
jgi:hypothetical protein